VSYIRDDSLFLFVLMTYKALQTSAPLLLHGFTLSEKPCRCLVATRLLSISSRPLVAKMLPDASSVGSNGGRSVVLRGAFHKLVPVHMHLMTLQCRCPMDHLQEGLARSRAPFQNAGETKRE